MFENVRDDEAKTLNDNAKLSWQSQNVNRSRNANKLHDSNASGDQKKLQIEKVHEHALFASREYKKAEHVLFEAVCEVDRYQVHAYFECSSLFEYCIKYLNISEAMACNMIAVARKSKQVPELKAAVMAGEVSVSTARKITPVINKDNSFEWIAKASTFTKAKLEKAVATERPQELVHDRAKYVSAERLEIKFGLDEKVMEKFKRAQDLVSQKTKSSASFELTLEIALDFYLDKNDPLKKAERNIYKSERKDNKNKDSQVSVKAKSQSVQGQTKNSESANPSVPGQTQDPESLDLSVPGQMQNPEKSNPSVSGQTQNPEHSTSPVPGQTPKPKRYIPAAIQHQVLVRDQNQCTHRSHEGKRCPNTRWLEVHHIHGFAQGGPHSLENLATLCSSHHRQTHI